MRDLGICFTLDPGPAVIAPKLGRSSSSNPCLWNSQPQALKVLQGYWGIKFVNATSQRCDNPLWHFLLQKYKHWNWLSSHPPPVRFILSHFVCWKLKLYSTVILIDLELLCPHLHREKLQIWHKNTSSNILNWMCVLAQLLIKFKPLLLQSRQSKSTFYWVSADRRTDIPSVWGNLRLLRE